MASRQQKADLLSLRNFHLEMLKNKFSRLSSIQRLAQEESEAKEEDVSGRRFAVWRAPTAEREEREKKGSGCVGERKRDRSSTSLVAS